MINKVESDFSGILYDVGGIYLSTYSVYADDKVEVKFKVYDRDRTYWKKVVRKGKFTGNLFSTSIDNNKFAVYLESGVIVPFIEEFEKNFILSSKMIDHLTLIPVHLEFDAKICKVKIKTFDIITGKIEIVAREGIPDRRNLLYSEIDGVKFNINIRTCAINKTLE